MTKPIHDLHLDFETFCDLDLKKVGTHSYVESCFLPGLVRGVEARRTYRATRQAVRRRITGCRRIWCRRCRNPDMQGHAFNAAFETRSS